VFLIRVDYLWIRALVSPSACSELWPCKVEPTLAGILTNRELYLLDIILEAGSSFGASSLTDIIKFN
jgi:hypothetical protein